MMQSYHDYLYRDPKRVREARIQAKGRIGARKLREAFVDSWAAPVVTWLARNLDRRPIQPRKSSDE